MSPCRCVAFGRTYPPQVGRARRAGPAGHRRSALVPPGRATARKVQPAERCGFSSELSPDQRAAFVGCSPSGGHTDLLVPVGRRLATPASARINQWGDNLTHGEQGVATSRLTCLSAGGASSTRRRRSTGPPLAGESAARLPSVQPIPSAVEPQRWNLTRLLVPLAVHGHVALSMQPSRVTPGG